MLAEPESGFGIVEQLIGSAHHSVQLTMYELNDPTTQAALTAAAARGVNVQVLLDQQRERSHNQPAYSDLQAHGVHVAWASPQYPATHQKTLIVDAATSLVMTANLVASDYPNTRDFLVVDTNPADVAAITQTFTADFTGAEITPPNGADLVWSPTNAKPTLLDLIGRAHTTLLVENEEMADPAITAALVAAAHRNVDVTVTMTTNRSYQQAFDQLRQAGVHVDLYPDSSRDLYIHAKAVVADPGTPQAAAFVGSENFSEISLTRNRELGIITSNPTAVGTVASVLQGDSHNAGPGD